jgi:oligopeptide/dipeptide ABC transporter ATP-binding protein
MYAGRIVELARTDDIFESPRHPYTRALLSAVPNPDPDVPMGEGLDGAVADVGALPGGCAFHPRCELAEDRCRHERPEFAELQDGRCAACHLVDPLNEANTAGPRRP